MMRELGNGNIAFPQRGNPPDCPDGYEPTSNPFVFAPILESCKYRVKEKRFSPCCGERLLTICTKKGLPTNGKACIKCKELEK